MTEVRESVMIPIDEFEPVEWNPNVEDLATFNTLVETIQQNGFTDPLDVVKVGDAYRIVGGEHRWKAGRQAGLKALPAVVHDWDEDEQMMQNVRLNQLRGKIDPVKFGRMWEQLRERHDRDTIMARMGFAGREKELDRLIGNTRKSIPKDMRAEFDKRVEKIQTVEDLAAVVQSLYARTGATLQKHGWMVLTFGGQTHLMIRMSDGTRKKLQKMLEGLSDAGGNADELAASVVERIGEEADAQSV